MVNFKVKNSKLSTKFEIFVLLKLNHLLHARMHAHAHTHIYHTVYIIDERNLHLLTNAKLLQTISRGCDV